MPTHHLHLLTSELPDVVTQPVPSAGPTRHEPTSSEESSALQHLRMERDAALEELAYLREQLRSTEAYYAHRFELLFAGLYSEHREFLEELMRLGIGAR